MRIIVAYGRERQDFEVTDSKWITGLLGAGPDLGDRAAAVRSAVEEPFGYPALRRALTPGDHITIVVDEGLPHLEDALIPVLEHVAGAGVAPANVTLVSAPTTSSQPWINVLPEEFEDVHVEVHDPSDRKRLSYLATTREGKRLYLNRSVVDADQLVVVCARRYDPLLGHGGAEGSIYPALSDAETLEEMQRRLSLSARDADLSPTRKEAVEASWLLGAPFFVQIIEGASGGWSSVVAGASDASEEAGRRLDARWRLSLPHRAELVVAALTGDPAGHTFADWAAAVACAARVVEPGGRIVLLAAGRPALGPAMEMLLTADEPTTVLKHLRREPSPETLPALQWAVAADAARLYVLSKMPDETVEDLFATPLQSAVQVQRLIDTSGRCLFVEDAHRALAVVEEGAAVSAR